MPVSFSPYVILPLYWAAVADVLYLFGCTSNALYVQCGNLFFFKQTSSSQYRGWHYLLLTIVVSSKCSDMFGAWIASTATSQSLVYLLNTEPSAI